MYNRWAGNDIAREMKKILSQNSEIKKKAADELAASSEVDSFEDPASFLVAKEREINKIDSLDESIESLESMAKDPMPAQENCAKCHELHDAKQDCAKDNALGEDYDFVVNDKKAHETLFQLGKLARSFKERGENFAADLVQATANDIIEDLSKTAAKKVTVISELKKIAKELESKDEFGVDYINAAILSIKNS